MAPTATLINWGHFRISKQPFWKGDYGNDPSTVTTFM